MTVSFIKQSLEEEVNGEKVCLYGENLKIKSSTVKAMSYQPHNQILTITFVKNEETYSYFRVPKEVYLELATSKSLGQAFHLLIKDKFKFKKAKAI